MVIMNMISVIVVGLYYASFSIFVRSAMEYGKTGDVFKPANLLENIYLVTLFLTLILSCSVKVENAKFGYTLFSIIFGALSVIMVVSSILFALDSVKGGWGMLTIAG